MIYVRREGQQAKRYSEEEVRRRLATGELLPTDLGWSESGRAWVPVPQLVMPQAFTDGQDAGPITAQPAQTEAAPPKAQAPPDPQTAQEQEFTKALIAATPKVLVTPVLIAVNLGIFVLMAISGLSVLDPTSAELVRWGADFGPLTLHGGWWRLLTSAFVHIGILHVAMNMYVLWAAGMFTERLFGNLGFLVLYLLAAIGGSLASVAWHPFTVAAGASGAVFGVYGGILGFVAVRRHSIPQRTVKSLSRSAATFIVFNVIYGLRPHIDFAAHLGGLATGLVAGLGLALPVAAFGDSSRVRRALIVALAGVALAIAIALKIPAGDEAQARWYRAEVIAPSITVGKKDTIIYTGEATEQDAKRLGQKLKEIGFFSDRGIEVLLSKGGRGGTELSLSVNDGVWNDQEFLAEIEDLGRRVAPSIGGLPVKMVLHNSEGQMKRTVNIGARARSGAE